MLLLIVFCTVHYTLKEEDYILYQWRSEETSKCRLPYRLICSKCRPGVCVAVQGRVIKETHIDWCVSDVLKVMNLNMTPEEVHSLLVSRNSTYIPFR